MSGEFRGEVRFQLDGNSAWWFSCGVVEHCSRCEEDTTQILDLRVVRLVCDKCGSVGRTPSAGEMAEMKRAWRDYWDGIARPPVAPFPSHVLEDGPMIAPPTSILGALLEEREDGW